MSSDTAKAGLILALLAAGKSFNILQGQPPLPVPVSPTNNVDPRILRGNFSITRAANTSGNVGLNPALDDFAQPFSPATGWGSAVARFPFTRIGLRALISAPVLNVSTVWVFYPQVYVASLGLYVVLPAPVQLTLTPTSPRILDTGLVQISTLGYAGFTQLTPGADILNIGETYLIAPGPAQPMVGFVELYGGL